jgi:hypothetical protein
LLATLILLFFFWRLGWFGDVAWLDRLLGPEVANASGISSMRVGPATFH